MASGSLLTLSVAGRCAGGNQGAWAVDSVDGLRKSKPHHHPSQVRQVVEASVVDSVAVVGSEAEGAASAAAVEVEVSEGAVVEASEVGTTTARAQWTAAMAVAVAVAASGDAMTVASGTSLNPLHMESVLTISVAAAVVASATAAEVGSVVLLTASAVLQVARRAASAGPQVAVTAAAVAATLPPSQDPNSRETEASTHAPPQVKSSLKR